MSGEIKTIHDVRNSLQAGHQKGNDTPERTLNRLWQKHLKGREDRYGKEFVENAPKNLTDDNVSASLEAWSTEKLGRLIHKDREKPPHREDSPVVIVKFRNRCCLIDGGKRITKWRTSKDTNSHDAYVLALHD